MWFLLASGSRLNWPYWSIRFMLSGLTDTLAASCKELCLQWSSAMTWPPSHVQNEYHKESHLSLTSYVARELVPSGARTRFESITMNITILCFVIHNLQNQVTIPLKTLQKSAACFRSWYCADRMNDEIIQEVLASSIPAAIDWMLIVKKGQSFLPDNLDIRWWHQSENSALSFTRFGLTVHYCQSKLMADRLPLSRS